MTDKPDPIGEAIAATDTPPMLEVPVIIRSSGRQVSLLLPVEPPFTESELAELCGWMLTGLLVQLRAIAEHRRSPIQVVRSMPS